ncbi:MAG: aminoacyl-tRNA hydrolase [Desulfurococcales archaeon ex4484_58]|nr:MAG: aminoacyl-tRNA hydrolase [Desulfurococcales archaeon ex4484_58]
MIEYKQVIVVRTDLEMSKGKLAVQVAHASVIAAFKAYHERREWFNAWWSSGQKKIVLRGKNMDELLKLARKAENKGLPVAIVRDAGLTELEPGTLTTIAIGPGPSSKIDEITGALKLL